jgi:hypothetical protein
MKEAVEIQHLTDKLQNLLLEQQKKFFEVWTQLVSDDILGLAHAFGERFMLQAACNALENDCAHAGAHNLLEKVIHLHMVEVVVENLGWYLLNGLITPAAAKGLVEFKD